MVLVFVLCLDLWLLAEGLFRVSCFVLFVALLLCLVDSVQNCDLLVRDKGTGCFAFLCLVKWIVYCLS